MEENKSILGSFILSFENGFLLNVFHDSFD